MAIKLSGSLSRKLPIQGIPYSSENFSAGLEIEINSAEAGEVQARLAGLYNTLSQAIDAQIAAADAQVRPESNGPVVNMASARTQAVPVQSAPPPTPQRPAYTNGNGRNRVAAVNGAANGNGRSTNATQAQQKAVWAICKNLGVEVSDVLSEIGLGDLQTLSVKQASTLIDSLKARQNVQ